MRRARLRGAHALRTDTRLMEFECDEPLGFVGGQFVSVVTGRIAASGRPYRRAYSILSPDREQRRFEIAVKRIDAGLCSGLLHDLPVGGEIAFTGPWGDFHPREGASGPLLVLATDTGITAALGLVRGARAAQRLHETTLVWLRTPSDYFLPEALVRSLIPHGCAEAILGELPPIGHVERVPHMRAWLRARPPVAEAFIAGDGAVNYALLDDLVAAGVPATRDSLESFFNFPRRTAT